MIAGSALALLLASYVVTRVMSAGEVMGRVEVAGTPIGGLDHEQAIGALILVEDSYTTRPAIFVIEKKLVSLQPAEAGLDIDTESMVQQALAVGRTGNPATEFSWWLTHIFSTEEIAIQGTIDDIALSEVFDTWDSDVIADPASPGAVSVSDGSIVPVYPHAGMGIDRGDAPQIVLATLLADVPVQAEIPTTLIQPRLTPAYIDEAVSEARAMVSAPVEMIYNGSSIVFSTDQLLHAFRSDTVVNGPTATIVNYFDPTTIGGYIDVVRAEFEAEPVDARYEITGDAIAIVPGLKGTRIDEDETADRLAAASLTPSRRGELPVVEAADPDVTTESLAALNINHLVSQFTTYYACCAPRVNNIQTMAATVSGTIVPAGEVFSLNDLIGERTEEKGYLAAPTIIGGELEDTVGGGVSQFTTTMYNAVFWGGYEDIEHKPHSYYFSRYPEGVEATLNWRTPDLKFRNNRSSGLLIETIATDTSITVRIFGDNDGRTLKGEQSGGRSKEWVEVAGGPNALHVKGYVSGRFAYTDPPSPHYEANPDLPVTEQVTLQEESQGWSVKVTREIYLGETQLLETQEWIVTYAPKFAVYEVHPCMMPGTSTTPVCPTTTTIIVSTTTSSMAP